MVQKTNAWSCEMVLVMSYGTCWGLRLLELPLMQL